MQVADWGTYSDRAIVALSIALFLVAATELWNNWKTGQHARIIERAYVTMSHSSEGLTTNGFTNETVNEIMAGFRIQDFTIAGVITNHGSTPADVLRYRVTHHVGQELPETPDYGEGATPAGAFLITGGSFFFKKSITLGAQQVEALKAGRAKLWIIGFVDYDDRFKQKHRSGYARRWEPYVREGEHNLVIEPTPGYNYDRKRDA